MKKDSVTVTNVIDRMLSPTPPFWQRVRKIGLYVTGAAGMLLAASGVGLPVPAAILLGAKIIGAISSSVAIQAQTTKTEPDGQTAK